MSLADPFVTTRAYFIAWTQSNLPPLLFLLGAHVKRACSVVQILTHGFRLGCDEREHSLVGVDVVVGAFLRGKASSYRHVHER